MVLILFGRYLRFSSTCVNQLKVYHLKETYVKKKKLDTKNSFCRYIATSKVRYKHTSVWELSMYRRAEAGFLRTMLKTCLENFLKLVQIRFRRILYCHVSPLLTAQRQFSTPDAPLLFFSVLNTICSPYLVLFD